ncbi:hypothetical protein BAU15_03655 [Enterococcus sp. JM4C]|uniref:hypothetical protein n=1 Tax=Candidatus Enterococcus huntleyi TaxID=1857217 RepID=UPI0013799A01|nr:hypothetical protein [Enterococcus sp. JM4C]KAF1295647.1 hypothetical protein BAU15_03655 [Enterococcus sp. JM4C]
MIKTRINELLKLGVLMTTIGLLIAFVGFSMAGFDYKAYHTDDTRPWYRVITFHTGNDDKWE